MYIKKKLNSHPYSNCYVEVTPDRTIVRFISYTTLVIEVNINVDGTREFECMGTFSQTTRKQIDYFLKEYFPDVNYYNMKDIVGCGKVCF